MKSKLALLFLSLGLGWLPTSTSAYCVGWDKSLPHYDPRYYSVTHEFGRAKYVVKARAVRETWLGEDGKPKPLKPPFQDGNPRPWGFDPYLGADYDVEVLEAFKGRPPTKLRLFSENTTARFWLVVGREYIFFVTDESFDPPIGPRMTIDTCGNSGLAEKGRSKLKAIERLSHRE